MASDPEKDDLAEEETDDGPAPAPVPLKIDELAPSATAKSRPSDSVAKSGGVAQTSTSKARTSVSDAASSSSGATKKVVKKAPIVVAPPDDEDDEDDEDGEDDEPLPPPPPSKKSAKKKGKKAQGAAVVVKAPMRRRKVGPKMPAKHYLPHCAVALALAGIDSRLEVPFHPLAVLGIMLLVYAFMHIGSANEVGTEV